MPKNYPDNVDDSDMYEDEPDIECEPPDAYDEMLRDEERDESRGVRCLFMQD